MRAVFLNLILLATLGLGADPSLGNAVEDVTFRSGDIVLAGHLYSPDGPGPHPAVVFTHGSGDAGRDNNRYRLEAEYFAGHGIASLVYDKRGYGRSTGDWHQATFEDLADDCLAAVAYLQTREEINGSRIGLRGASQSGWILPIAADKSSDVAYLILVSPAGVTPYEQILFDVRMSLEESGHSGREVDEALTLLRSGLEYARTGEGWEAHARALEAAKDASWLPIASGPPVADHWLWSWIRPVIDFDVLPVLERISTPVLVVLGEDDRECPSQIAGYVHEKAFRNRPKGSYAIRYFPGADHGIRVAANRVGDEEPPLADGYLETLRDWILNAEAVGP